MKILLATSAAVPWGGGVASYNQELVRELGKGNDIYLLTDADEADVKGYTATRSLYGKPVRSYSYCSELVEWINSGGYELIINSNSGVLPYLSPFINAPIVSVSHFVNGKPANNAGYNSRYLNGIVALSNYGKKYLTDRFDIHDEDKVRVIYNFVEANPSPYDASKEGAAVLRIVYPGGTTVHKSMDVVMEMLYDLLKTDLRFEFVWLGNTKVVLGDFSPLGRLHTYQMISDPRVKITGKVSREEAVEYISSANVFLLPSIGEGCPMTLLEAMREGCIPVVSDAPHGSREILELCGCGEIVKQGDAAALSEVLQHIIENHGDYTGCYRKTYDFAYDSLSESRWSGNMHTLVASAVSGTKRCERMSRHGFLKSMLPFVLMQASARFRELCSYLRCRVRLDYMYIKNKHKNR